jgi:hypothetical protein
MNFRTEQERRLVSFMQEAYGELLSLFLLSGLGEEGFDGLSYFTVCELGAGGEINRRRVAVTSDGDTFLPHGRDPLILAALLKLLPGHETHRVKCRPSDLTALLGWEGIAGAGQAAAGAIERYYAASLAVLVPSEELYFGESPAFAHSQRILIEYETVDSEGDGMTHVNAAFNPTFVDRLRSKSLLGIDWGRVVAIEV